MAAILAALLLHLAAIAALLDKRPLDAPPPPAPIPIELAYAPPEPPPPAPEQPAPQQQLLPERHAGGDLENATPGSPPAATEADEQPPAEASPPSPERVPQTPEPVAAPPEPEEPAAPNQPAPPLASPADTQEAMIPPPLPPTKPPVPTAPNAAVPAAAEPPAATASPDADPKLGEGGGDRYLNAMRDKIDRHLVYPPTAELFHITGVATYQIVINRQGELLTARVSKSSGFALLDNAGLQTIRLSAPFEPVPDDLPGDRLRFILILPMRP